METVVLLNQDFSFVGIINWQRAINLLIKNKVEVIEYSKRTVRNFESTVTMKIPKIMKLLYYVKNFYKQKIKFNRKNIFLRDNYECGYCLTPGDKKNKLTIDHIIPRSRDGEHNFKNTVTCCSNCNSKKKNKTPEEAGMTIRKRIYEPSFYDLFKDKLNNIFKGLSGDLYNEKLF